MTTAVVAPVTRPRPADGGRPARRAVVRWAWRLFRREWRQQALIFGLITLAVAGTIVGSAIATDTPPSAAFGFGTADDAATFSGLGAHARSVIAGLEHRFGTVELIESETEPIPGSISTYQLRAQDPHGPFGRPMLALLSGRYPASAGEVAVTPSVAAAFHLRLGDRWAVGGATRRVVGTVENPQSLLDSFALVVPGQVPAPTQVVALFDAPGVRPAAIGPEVQTPASVARSNLFDPETISLAAVVLGMLLIALVSVGGFTVLAQRRLRSIGMLEATGATDRHVRLVVQANGTVVGLLGALSGVVLGLVVWLGYRPSLETSAHHVVGVLALPWTVVVVAVGLAVLAAYVAAARPARAVTQVPVVTALSGRPAPPGEIHRSAVPGVVCLVAAFLLLGYAGGTGHGHGSGGTPELLLGIVLLIPGLVLLAPFFLSVVGRVAGRTPIAVRLALRDLARYRARSGSALAAISVGVLAAVIVVLAASARYGNVLDYAGPNLAANQLAVHAPMAPPPGAVLVTPNGRSKGPGPAAAIPSPARLAAGAAAIAKGLGAQLVRLETPDAQLSGREGGRSWTGTIYVATPQLLRAFGIRPSQIQPDADVLSSRPGLSGVSELELSYGSGGQPGDDPAPAGSRCDCVPHPVIEEVPALPTGTSAPNTVLTEHAIETLHIPVTTTDWLVQAAQPFTAAQVSSAEQAAATDDLAVESKNDQPTSSAVVDWATVFGIVVALGVLGMSVGLVRSETAGDLRTLAATGASSVTRRTLTAATAGALGFLGSLLGVLGGYLGMIGWLRSNSLNGGIAALGNVPVGNLLVILLGMPALAAAVGWLFAGRQPPAMTHAAIE